MVILKNKKYPNWILKLKVEGRGWACLKKCPLCLDLKYPSLFLQYCRPDGATDKRRMAMAYNQLDIGSLFSK